MKQGTIGTEQGIKEHREDAPGGEARRPAAARSRTRSEAAALLKMIERMAANPDVDAGKLDGLMRLQERAAERQRQQAFIRDLTEMQPDLPVIAERGQISAPGKRTYTYALWEDINEIIKPVLARHGFVLSFRTGREGSQIKVAGVLSHREGHSEETVMLLPADRSPGMNAVQAVGSATSYGKRYAAQALLNLTSCGEDDDGGATGSQPLISADQLEGLEASLATSGAHRDRFLRYLGVPELAALPASRFDHAVQILTVKTGRAA